LDKLEKSISNHYITFT